MRKPLNRRRFLAACCSILFLTFVVAFWIVAPANTRVHAQIVPVQQTPHQPVNSFLPIVAGPQATPVPAPDVGVGRAQAVALYNDLYLPATKAEPNFSGDVAACVPGAISAARLAALEKQINYYRTMAGVEPIVLDTSMNQLAQAAALIMGANWDLSHYPGPAWQCYSENGREGAFRSNIGLGLGELWKVVDGEPRKEDWLSPIFAYMDDYGSGILGVGHRDWLLNPHQVRMGAGEVYMMFDLGSTPPRQYLDGAHAVHVYDPDVRYDRPWPALRDSWLVWPNAGYVPHQVIYPTWELLDSYYPRWSLHIPDGSFENATVEMWMDDQPLPATIIYATTDDNRERVNTPVLVWEPQIEFLEMDWSVSHRFRVLIQQVRTLSGNASLQTIDYTVIIFDPTR